MNEPDISRLLAKIGRMCGGEPAEFPDLLRIVRQEVDAEESDELAFAYLHWLTAEAVRFGDAEYLEALQEKYRRFPDSVSAIGIANALSSSDGEAGNAADWAGRALDHAQAAGQAVRYVLAEQVRLFLRLGRWADANSALAMLVKLGRRGPNDDDVDLPQDILRHRGSEHLDSQLVNSYGSLLD